MQQIVNLVSTKPRVSKLEFFVALALVALAQTGKGEFGWISTGNMTLSPSFRRQHRTGRRAIVAEYPP